MSKTTITIELPLNETELQALEAKVASYNSTWPADVPDLTLEVELYSALKEYVRGVAIAYRIEQQRAAASTAAA
jgi:hypothetical protein